MRYAAIVPEECLLVPTQVRHSFHLVLAHKLLESAGLRAHYQSAGRRGDFIMVDNGVAEQADIPFIDVVRVATEIGANEIVLPDVIGDWEASVSATRDPNHTAIVPASMRAVAPHGETQKEFQQCITALSKIPFATIALTKGLERVPGGRAWCIQELYRVGMLDTHHIHLLGAPANPYEDIRRLKFLYPEIRSIDSVAPFSYAQVGLRLDSPDLRIAKRPSMDWTQPVSDVELALDNFYTFRRWINE